MNERIVWTATKYGIEGRAGGFQLFSIARGLLPHGPPYALDSRLPVRSGHFGQVHPTITHAKAAAENVLTAFIARVSEPVEQPDDHGSGT